MKRLNLWNFDLPGSASN